MSLKIDRWNNKINEEFWKHYLLFVHWKIFDLKLLLKNLTDFWSRCIPWRHFLSTVRSNFDKKCSFEQCLMGKEEIACAENIGEEKS
ncbi:unnamed protein product [Blepharisma stoltei]|uniref:Uncharacterized protein n=1 Tax=Blepharisma stoltei TaxID=1481888 RepID=A0AAU9IZQ4_9CILI|nr:unnamed protein product [Blepharisma stoltei]